MLTSLRSILNSNGVKFEFSDVYFSLYREPKDNEFNFSFFGSPYISTIFEKKTEEDCNFLLNVVFDINKPHPYVSMLKIRDGEKNISITTRVAHVPLSIKITYGEPEFVEYKSKMGAMYGKCHL